MQSPLLRLIHLMNFSTGKYILACNSQNLQENTCIRHNLATEIYPIIPFHMAKTEDNILLSQKTYSKRSVHRGSSHPREIDKLSKPDLYKEYREMGKREERMLSMLDQSVEMIFVLDPLKQVLLINQPAKEFFHQPHIFSTEKHSPFLKDISAPLQSVWNAIIERAMLATSFEESLVLDRKGISHHYKLRFKPQLDERNTLKELWFFCRDVTEEELALETIHKKQAMLESISNSVQEGIFRSSTEEGIIYVNQAFARMFGYDSTEEIMKIEPYELYMDPSRRDDFVQLVEERGSFFNEEVEFKRKDGSSFWGLISSVPVQDKSGKKYHDGAVRDVTQLKEVERGLKDNYKELQKVNRELDRFVYSTSHDLRAPLVSIAGLINITRIEKDETLRQKYLGLMDTSIQKLDDFIKDIIGYSRNARLEVKCEPVDFQQLLEPIFEALRPKDDSSSIQTSIKIEAEGEFLSDHFRLKTIFNNLLSNAFRYYDPTKDAPFIEVSIVQDMQFAHLTVKDNGIGIEEKYLDKIFQMFYRASQKSQGSGIGLYIVKESIEKLGGSIEVQSEIGVGTSFTLKIPQGEEG